RKPLRRRPVTEGQRRDRDVLLARGLVASSSPSLPLPPAELHHSRAAGCRTERGLRLRAAIAELDATGCSLPCTWRVPMIALRFFLLLAILLALAAEPVTVLQHDFRGGQLPEDIFSYLGKDPTQY